MARLASHRPTLSSLEGPLRAVPLNGFGPPCDCLPWATGVDCSLQKPQEHPEIFPGLFCRDWILIYLMMKEQRVQ